MSLYYSFNAVMPISTEHEFPELMQQLRCGKVDGQLVSKNIHQSGGVRLSEIG